MPVLVTILILSLVGGITGTPLNQVSEGSGYLNENEWWPEFMDDDDYEDRIDGSGDDEGEIEVSDMPNIIVNPDHVYNHTEEINQEEKDEDFFILSEDSDTTHEDDAYTATENTVTNETNKNPLVDNKTENTTSISDTTYTFATTDTALITSINVTTHKDFTTNSNVTTNTDVITDSNVTTKTAYTNIGAVTTKTTFTTSAAIFQQDIFYSLGNNICTFGLYLLSVQSVMNV